MRRFSLLLVNKNNAGNTANVIKNKPIPQKPSLLLLAKSSPRPRAHPQATRHHQAEPLPPPWVLKRIYLCS